jgi:hypothetical protein
MRINQCDLGERFWSMAEVGYTWATSGSPLGSRALLRASVTIHPFHATDPNHGTRGGQGQGQRKQRNPARPKFPRGPSAFPRR